MHIVTSDPARSDATCTFSEDPELIIGTDESDINQLFSIIRGTGRLSDGSVAAVDRQTAEVRIFDETGRHLRSMGERGAGPGEFLDPYSLWVTAGDTLWVGNARPWRYNVFTAQGDFVRTVSVEPLYLNPSRAGGVLDNGYTVNSREESFRSPNFAAPDTLIVEIHDPAGRLVGSLAKLPHGTSGNISGAADNRWFSTLFEAEAEVDARGSTIVLAHGSKAEIQVLDETFSLRAIIRWFEPDREVTGADIRAWREEYQESRPRPSSPNAQANYDASLSSERPAADRFPAISSVRVGRDGRIWVHRYNRPREHRGWLAFSADGEFFCHMAELPGGVREFGEDYVLLLHLSELGLHTLQMHRLTTPETPAKLATSP